MFLNEVQKTWRGGLQLVYGCLKGAGALYEYQRQPEGNIKELQAVNSILSRLHLCCLFLLGYFFSQ